MSNFDDEKKKTIMVTGGAGYVGSILIRKLLQNGYRVVCVDILKFGGGPLIDICDNPDFMLHKVDITDFDKVGSLFDLHELYAVVHLANRRGSCL
jgi:nucleoside-diphosphate-sugar epimerase